MKHEQYKETLAELYAKYFNSPSERLLREIHSVQYLIMMVEREVK